MTFAIRTIHQVENQNMQIANITGFTQQATTTREFIMSGPLTLLNT